MKAAKIAFEGTTGRLLNYCSNIRQITITRSAAGRYIIAFLTPCLLDEAKDVYPIINVTCQAPTGTATVVNVLNPTSTYQSRNEEGFVYQISFQIEVQDIVLSVTLPSVLLTLLGYTFNVATFVDRPVIMVDCQYTQRVGQHSEAY